MAEAGEDSVDLGFAEKCEDEFRMLGISYPSKLGGKPAWLRWDSLLTESQVHCNNCDTILQFLCQIYVPTELEGQQYHRTLYVFCCSNGKCYSSKKSCVRVFRSLQEESEEDLTEEDLDKKAEEELRKLFESKQALWTLCEVCSLNGDKKCSLCHEAYYCSKEHQVFDWKFNKHKKNCKDRGTGLQFCYIYDFLHPLKKRYFKNSTKRIIVLTSVISRRAFAIEYLPRNFRPRQKF